MAGLAYIRGVDVATWQVVTTHTGAVDFIVVNSKWRNPGSSSMTGLAKCRGINVTARQTMTAHTGTVDFIVIHGEYRHPGI